MFKVSKKFISKMSIIWNIAELDMDDYEHLKPYQRLCQIP